MIYLIKFILFFLTFSLNLWSYSQRNITYIEDHDHYAVEIFIGEINDLIFVTYEDIIPEDWEIVESQSNYNSISNYTLSGNKLIWFLNTDTDSPIILSYAVQNPSASTNSLAIFNGKITGWDRYTFEKYENITIGDTELFELKINIEGKGTVSRSSQANWFKLNESLDLAAISFEDSVLNKWSYLSGLSSLEYFTNEISILVSEPVEITANFDNLWKINAQNSELSPHKDFYLDGEVVEVYADVPYGFEFESWSGNILFENSNPIFLTVSSEIDIQPILKAQEWSAFSSRNIQHLESNTFKVSLDVFPNKNSTIFAFEEEVPYGWEVNDINLGGMFDEKNSKIKWGAFFGNEKKTLTYNIKFKGTNDFSPYLFGDLSIDGLSQESKGSDSLVLIDGTDNTAVNIQEETVYDSEGIILKRVLKPKSATSVYAYEEIIEDGWVAVDINNFGLFDEKKSKVKWGLFFGDDPITIEYKLMPKTDEYYEIEPFGTAAFDGIVNNLINQKDLQPVSGSLGTAWVEMQSELVFSQVIPIKINITPFDLNNVYAIEKIIPSGLVPSNISHDGVFDFINNKIKWGVFIGPEPLTLSYDLIPTFSVAGNNHFEGSVSFDGISKSIYGNMDLNFGNFAYWFLEKFRDFPHLAAPFLDADGDGISNILEYGFGSNPINTNNSGSYPFYEVFIQNSHFVYELFIQKEDLSLKPLVKSNILNDFLEPEEHLQIFKTDSSTRFEYPLLSGNSEDFFIKAEVSYDPQ